MRPHPHLETERQEAFGERGCGGLLGKAELRIGMKLPAKRDPLWRMRRDEGIQ